MSRLIILFIIQIFISTQINTQPWHYNFGTETGSFSLSNTVSTTFLPQAPTGITQVKVSNGGGGSFNLENQVIPFGEGVYLRISGPGNSSVSKFSIYDYSPGKCFTMRFRLRLGNSDGSNLGATAGIWYFFTGDGTSFSDLSTFSGTQSFAGLQLTFGASGTITTNYRSGTNWVPTGLTGTPFTQGVDYVVELYGNNSLSMQNYLYCDTARTVGPNKWDLWINGNLIGDELNKAALAANANIDSWMFYGISCYGNAANIFLDEFDYSNEISQNPLPVNLSYFQSIVSGRKCLLSWQTEWEINNAGFDIERACEDIGTGNFTFWLRVGFAEGLGTSLTPKSYFFEDKNLKSGTYRYRLEQLDFNGNTEYFTCNNDIVIGKPDDFVLEQNYPNPSNPKCKINYQLPFDGYVMLKVYDMTGKEITTLVNESLKADYYEVNFDGSNLASGVYFYRISAYGENQEYTKTMKMVILK